MGQKIILKSNLDKDKAEEILELVQTKLAEAEKRVQPGMAPQYAAVLALVDFAEDHIRMKSQMRSELNRWLERFKALEGARNAIHENSKKPLAEETV